MANCATFRWETTDTGCEKGPPEDKDKINNKKETLAKKVETRGKKIVFYYLR